MIYLDHNAGWPLLAEAREAMLPWLGRAGNPASVHRAGQQARMALEKARRQVASLLGRSPTGLVFTSGATEANHMALRGLHGQGRTVRASRLEHPCVVAAAELCGAEWMAVGATGQAKPVRSDVLALMAANHETGVLQDLPAARELADWLHVDAAQALGRAQIDLSGADSVVASAHKLGGPCGIGALSLMDGEAFPALLSGGSQERGRRAGTSPVALAVGFGAAAEIAERELSMRLERWRTLQSQLELGLRALGGRVVGAEVPRLANTSLVVFEGHLAETLVQHLDLQGICISAGAACSSGSVDASPVLVAMGEEHPSSAVRISSGPDTTPAMIEAAIAALQAATA